MFCLQIRGNADVYEKEMTELDQIQFLINMLNVSV